MQGDKPEAGSFLMNLCDKTLSHSGGGEGGEGGGGSGVTHARAGTDGTNAASSR